MLPAANLLGGLFLVLAVAVVGLPPLSGFLGKVMILKASLASPWMPWVLGVVLTTSLLALAALTRAGTTLFFKTDPEAGTAILPSSADLVPVIALATGSLLLVGYAGPLYDYVQATAEQLIYPAGYIAAVLGQATGVTSP
jgi:multicomponent K+:H+ antiporter subunit D